MFHSKNGFCVSHPVHWVFVLLSLVLVACSGESDTSSDNPELQMYREARAAYSQQDYDLAITRFTAQLDRFPSGTYADDAHMYKGRSHYWLLDYINALTEFDLILSDFFSGNQMDAAQYWKAKVFHAQHNFTQARIEYALVDPLGIYADNAAFHTARTYFGEAQLITVPADAYGAFDVAIVEFELVKVDYVGTTTDINADYYLGRSYHEQALLLQIDPGLAPVTVPATTAATLFGSARTAYASTTIVSTYNDNAQYYFGRSYYDETGDFQTNAQVYTAYQRALNAWASFKPGMSLASSNYAHAALYFSGHSYNAMAQLLLADSTLDMTTTATEQQSNALSAYQGSVNADATGVYADNAQYSIGRAYYDQAQLQTVNRDIMQSYQSAVNALQDFRSNGVYALSSYADNGSYFLGLSLHEQALLLHSDASLSIYLSTPLSVAQLFAQARLAYQNVIANDAAAIYADNSQYYVGKTYYDEGLISVTNTQAMSNYELALGEWQIFTAGNFLQASAYAHRALYFCGRSRQQQAVLLLLDPALDTVSSAQRFTEAEQFYDAAINNDSQGVYADNAYYRIGQIYYDDAVAEQGLAEAAITTGAAPGVIQNHYTNAQQALNVAINQYDIVTIDYQGSSSEDQAWFYLGRSYHRVARIEAVYRLDLSANVGGLDFTVVDYPVARSYYQNLITDAAFANSPWLDNAYYHLGNTHFEQAPTGIDAPAQQLMYNNALANYHYVVTNFADSIRLDDSAYQMGLVYHDTGYCAEEQIWLTFVVGITGVEFNLLADANAHLGDLATALQTPTALHPCDASLFPGLTTGLPM